MRACSASNAGGQVETMAAIARSSTRLTCAEAPGATVSSACSRCATVVLMPGGSMLRSSPIVAGVHRSRMQQPVNRTPRAADPDGEIVGDRQFSIEAQQRLAHNGGEERAGGLVRSPRADDHRRQAQRHRVQEAATAGVGQDQLRRGLLRAIAAARHLPRVIRQRGVLVGAEGGDRTGKHHPRRASPAATRARQRSITASVPRRLTRRPRS